MNESHETTASGDTAKQGENDRILDSFETTCDGYIHYSTAKKEFDKLREENAHLRKLVEAQAEYIDLLSDASASSAVFLAVHNWYHPESVITKAQELRDRIESLKIKE
jgi:hypothetical protein